MGLLSKTNVWWSRLRVPPLRWHQCALPALRPWVGPKKIEWERKCTNMNELREELCHATYRILELQDALERQTRVVDDLRRRLHARAPTAGSVACTKTVASCAVDPAVDRV